MRIHVVACMGLGGAALLAVSAMAFAEGSGTWLLPPPPPPPALDAGATPAANTAAPTTPTPPPVDAGSPADAEPAPDATVAPPVVAPASAAEVVAIRDVDAGYTPTDVGFSFGLRGGYSAPFGTANGGSLSDVVQGVVPIGADVGWFFNPHLYVGAYFFYGFGINTNSSNDTCNGLGASGFPESCTATMLRFGAVAHWHFLPKASWDPWVGGGLGYDIINLEAQDLTAGTLDSSASVHGFVVSAESGLDYKPLPYFGLGPYVELATGHYSSDTSSTSLHAWLTFGFRLRTNL